MNEGGVFKRVSLFIIFFWLILFVLLPNLLVFFVSVLKKDEIDLISYSFTFENYIKIFASVYGKIFLHSIKIALYTTVCTLIIGYPFAYILSKTDKRYRNFFLMLVIIPFWTSSLVRTYAIMILIKSNGVINTILTSYGLINEPIEMLYTEFAVILGLTYSLLPFMVLPLYASLEKIDNKLVEAAEDLGAGKVGIFTKIIFPLSTPGVIAGSLLVFLPALGMFYIPDILGGAKDMMLGNLIKNQFLTSRDWPFGSSLSIILTVMMLLLLTAYHKSANSTSKKVF